MGLKQFVKQINNLLGKNIVPIYEKKRTGDILHSFADIEMISKKLNLNVTISFSEGLRLLIK